MAMIDDVAASGGAEALGGRMILTHSFDDPIHGLVVGRYREFVTPLCFLFSVEIPHDSYTFIR